MLLRALFRVLFRVLLRVLLRVLFRVLLRLVERFLGDIRFTERFLGEARLVLLFGDAIIQRDYKLFIFCIISSSLNSTFFILLRS